MTSKLLANLPIENASDMITDPSTPDITGRVLELSGHIRKMNYLRNKTKCDKLVNECTRGKWIMVWEMGDLLYIWYVGCYDRFTVTEFHLTIHH